MSDLFILWGPKIGSIMGHGMVVDHLHGTFSHAVRMHLWPNQDALQHFPVDLTVNILKPYSVDWLQPQELQLELPHAQLESFQAPEILMILAVASDIPVYLYLTLLTSLHKSCLRHGRDLLWVAGCRCSFLSCSGYLLSGSWAFAFEQAILGCLQSWSLRKWNWTTIWHTEMDIKVTEWPLYKTYLGFCNNTATFCPNPH